LFDRPEKLPSPNQFNHHTFLFSNSFAFGRSPNRYDIYKENSDQREESDLALTLTGEKASNKKFSFL